MNHLKVKAILLFGSILCFLWSCSVNPMSEKGQSLSFTGVKATANGKFLGNIWGGNTEPLNFSKYWNQVTPENAGKWGSVELSQGTYNWSDLDAQYSYAKSKGFPFKFHNLVWGSQQPSWISSLSATNQVLAVIDWISNVGARYSNLDFIDVVNEPIKTGQPPYGAAIGGSGSTGWDWVIFAFTVARKYCGNAKLLVNEYSVENDTSAAAQYTNIINLLKSRNLIDGVGIQGHYFSLDSDDTGTLSNCLSIILSTGLPIYISELDLDGDDATQLSRYQKYFPILWNYSTIKGVTLWGYIQGSIWTTNAYLLTTSGTERPALTWLMQYVGNTTSTSSSSPVASSSSAASSVPVSSSRSSAASSIASSVAVSSSQASSIASSASSSVQYQNITLPFSFDGTGELYWQTSGTITSMNSWNLDALDVNGTSFKNVYVAGSSLPAKQNGYYYIHYKGSYSYSHVEIAGTSGSVSSSSIAVSSSPASSVASSIAASSSRAASSIAASSSRSSIASSVAVSSSLAASSVASSAASSTASSTSGGYAVNYTVNNDWGAGATVTVTIKNNSATALSSWSLVWTFAGNQQITQIWSATQTTSGATVTVNSLTYNGAIGANGGTQSFGFNLSYSGSNAKPAAFTLNGTACSTY